MGKHALGQRFFDLMGLKAYVLLTANIPEGVPTHPFLWPPSDAELAATSTPYETAHRRKRRQIDWFCGNFSRPLKS
jgi:hypothetical protein